MPYEFISPGEAIKGVLSEVLMSCFGYKEGMDKMGSDLALRAAAGRH